MAPPPAIAELGESALRHELAGNDLELEGSSVRVELLGIDTASIDYGPSKDFIVHRVAMGAGIPGLENLDHLDALPEKGAWLVALPMKIGGGSGAPLRAVAFLPR